VNLRRRFTTLVVGSVLAPIVTLFLLVVALGYLPISRDMQRLEEVHEERERGIDLPLAEEMTRTLPGGVVYAIVSGDGEVLSNTGAAELSTAATHGGHYELSIFPIRDADEDSLFYLLIATPDPSSSLPLVLAAMIVLILVFSSVMSIMTVRSIRRSLSKLTHATSSVARGDLDFSLDIPRDDSFFPLARSVEWMRDRVREEYDRRTRFFMGVSHDLKTPLASISGFSNALLDEVSQDPESRKRYAKIIRDKSELLQDRIVQLMDYIKLANGDFQASLEAHDLTVFLEDFVRVNMEEAGFSGRSIDASVDLKGPILVNFDPDLVIRALENLVSNAFRHGTSGGTVVFRAFRSGDQIVITCSNPVTDVPAPDELRRLFDPFYRRDQARAGDGFGLGLASTSSIVASHGWQIDASCPDMRSIRFTIRVPLSPKRPLSIGALPLSPGKTKSDGFE
jgi:signal transduction histidine kinase